MSEYTINYSVDGWPICKNGEPIFRKKLLLAELQQLQAECERLEAEKAKLVEALEDIGASWHGANTELEKYMRNVGVSNGLGYIRRAATAWPL